MVLKRIFFNEFNYLFLNFHFHLIFFIFIQIVLSKILPNLEQTSYCFSGNGVILVNKNPIDTKVNFSFY